MATFPTEAAERLVEYNSDFYDANTNPCGFADGGHIPNFPAALQDTASVLAYIAATAQEVQDHAQEVVDNLALVVAARDLSMKWAANPEDAVVQGGLFSAFHYARKAAASATAAATFNPALFAKLAGDTFTGLVSFFVGTAERAGLNIGQRASTPSTATNGDIWATASGLFYRIAGATRQAYDAVSLPRPTNALIDAGIDAVAKSWSVLDVWRAARGAVAEVGPLSGFRNKLINTHQHINLRGYVSNTATTAANQYTVDRWRVVVSGQRLTWAMDAAGVPTYTAPAGGVEQVIEAVNIEPATYTLSWIGTATATVNGAAVAKGAQVTLDGQANATVRFSGGTFSLPQLERGTIATAPERRPLQVEQMLAARYAWRFDISAGAAYSVGNNGATAQTTVPLPVPGRVQGTIVPNSGTTASQTNISGAAYSVTARSVTLTITQGSAAGNYNVYVLNILLDMEI